MTAEAKSDQPTRECANCRAGIPHDGCINQARQFRDFWCEMRPSLTLGLGAYGAYAIRPHDDGGWGWYQIGDPEADHGECDRQGRSATIDGCVSAILGRQEDATCAEPTVGEVAACVAALDERMDRYDPSKNTRIHDRFTDLDVRLARLEEWRKGRDQ